VTFYRFEQAKVGVVVQAVCKLLLASNLILFFGEIFRGHGNAGVWPGWPDAW
jgi:hypothetical protein